MPTGRIAPALLTAALAVGGGACSGSGAQPGISGDSGDGPPSGPASLWSELTKSVTCSPSEDAVDCTPGELRVTHAGHFEYSGPAGKSQGQLTGSELSDVNDAAGEVVAQDLQGQPACMTSLSLPDLTSNSVRVKTSPASAEITVLNLGESGPEICIRGEKAKVDRLDTALYAIFERVRREPPEPVTD